MVERFEVPVPSHIFEKVHSFANVQFLLVREGICGFRTGRNPARLALQTLFHGSATCYSAPASAAGFQECRK
ncbi:hypothetical protein [Fulvimarina sp. MAC8]|uniref:hypothetical protein n=1 Tax=Fulvimarina sp. MAC8 TaxID=3162874 RepID=UPI0032F04EE3